MRFWCKTNFLFKLIFPNYIWHIPNNKRKIFLTFDDGPTPELTEWVLSELKKYDAKATFFCIGNNIEKYPEIFQKIIRDNHSIGNHTFNHVNGWKTNSSKYLENVKLCETQILKFCSSQYLFRPPYGNIKPSQSKILRMLGFKIIMWDILTYDFDKTTTSEKCMEIILKNIENGSVIVFHDSKKSAQNLKYALPKTLAILNENGYVCSKID